MDAITKFVMETGKVQYRHTVLCRATQKAHFATQTSGLSSKNSVMAGIFRTSP